jgi:retinol dehydrogenase-12
MWLREIILARTTEQGSRQLIWACIGGKDNIDQLRGAYISSMQIREPSDFVVGEEGKRAQTKLWVSNHSVITTALLTSMRLLLRTL